MDKYDFLLLNIIEQHKKENQQFIKLNVLEDKFWKRVETNDHLNIGQAKVGERITKLYLSDMVQNKDGYHLTKKGREALSFQLV